MDNTLKTQVQEPQDSARELDIRELLRWLDERGWLAPLDTEVVATTADRARDMDQ